MPSRSKSSIIDLDATAERLKDPRNMKDRNGKRIPRVLAKNVAKETAKGVVQREKVYRMYVEQRMSIVEIAGQIGFPRDRHGTRETELFFVDIQKVRGEHLVDFFHLPIF